eukprot:5051755-Pyramimonas_sp.AAC.1
MKNLTTRADHPGHRRPEGPRTMDIGELDQPKSVDIASRSGQNFADIKFVRAQNLGHLLIFIKITIGNSKN